MDCTPGAKGAESCDILSEYGFTGQNSGNFARSMVGEGVSGKYGRDKA